MNIAIDGYGLHPTRRPNVPIDGYGIGALIYPEARLIDRYTFGARPIDTLSHVSPRRGLGLSSATRRRRR
jgi:hypothetical protein